MKKYIVFFMSFCLLLLASHADSDDCGATRSVISLPLNLKIIEAEAFSGTVPDIVILQGIVEFIGERAFSDISTLSDIYIPQITEHIADNAFSGTDVTIHGIEGSFADQWAKEHGFRFIHEDIWCPMVFSNNLLKMRVAHPIVYTVSSWPLLLICLVNGLYRRNRKCVRDYPELRVIDLAFP